MEIFLYCDWHVEVKVAVSFTIIFYSDVHTRIDDDLLLFVISSQVRWLSNNKICLLSF